MTASENSYGTATGGGVGYNPNFASNRFQSLEWIASNVSDQLPEPWLRIAASANERSIESARRWFATEGLLLRGPVILVPVDYVSDQAPADGKVTQVQLNPNAALLHRGAWRDDTFTTVCWRTQM
ncbi:hypothetical protein BDZ89DRAFT_1050455 [Hymenopellis radicata]|nr:hypothetical protein BDZ89DRAFT_1050455 [Hymenopellis radicata]